MSKLFNIDEPVEFTAEAAGDAIVLWYHGVRSWEDPDSLQLRSRTLPKPITIQPEAEAAFVALAKALGYEVQKVAP